MTLPARAAARLKALILILTAVFFAQKFVSGTLYYYIGPRFGWLSLLAVMLLILIGGAYDLTRREDEADEHQHHEHEHDHHHGHDAETVSAWPLLLVSLPLILGVLIPVQPLGASAVGNRGVSTDIAAAAGEETQTLTIVPGERNVLDWVRAISESADPAELTGEAVDVIGFVYRDVRFNEDQFMVSRFTITCCVADAMAIGLVVEADGAADFPADSWVRVRGALSEGAVYGDPMPVVLAEEVTPVQVPEHPYLYP